MRILIATGLYPPDIGGPAKYAQKIVEELTRRGLSPHLVVWGKMERMLPWGVRHGVYFLRLLPRLVRVDAILALDTWSTGLPAVCAAKLFGKKILVRVGGDPLWENYIERTGEMITLTEFYKGKRKFTRKERLVFWATGFLLRHSDMLLFNTRWQMEIWRRAYGFPSSRARVLENEYASVRAESTASSDKKVFVAAGRGITYKNISAFTKAFVEVKKRHPDIELDTKQLTPQENKARIMSAYALAVPSVSEVNSNFIIEGLAAGKPFIIARDSGMYEKLKDLGVFVDTQDSTVLERAIEELLDEEIYKKYVHRIHAFSYTHTWEQIVDEILDAAH